jgi:hypothetical protein
MDSNFQYAGGADGLSVSARQQFEHRSIDPDLTDA